MVAAHVLAEPLGAEVAKEGCRVEYLLTSIRECPGRKGGKPRDLLSSSSKKSGRKICSGASRDGGRRERRAHSYAPLKGEGKEGRPLLR